MVIKNGMLGGLILLWVAFALPEAGAQSCFRISFTDKVHSLALLDKPATFLSERSIQRRMRQQIPLEESDLPVSRIYIDSVVNKGALLLHTSRWMNSITVKMNDDRDISALSAFVFVKEIELTRPAIPGKKRAAGKFGTPGWLGAIDTSFYGASAAQVGQLNGHMLHQQGFKGEGIVIAVLDAGFYGVNTLPAFESLRGEGRIAGSRDFVDPRSDIFGEHPHGMMVLSAMGGLIPGRLAGTAPGATYWLIRTEDDASEYLIEEDNWIAGAELADSVGAYIINSSVGYSDFDMAEMDHTYADMDGSTTRVARAANMAVSKGLLVFSSAGNEGSNPWQKIISPADGDSVIAVAAVNREGKRAAFSSMGPAPDGALKPDLAAMGQQSAVQGINGLVTAMNGTSFSSPILAGMAACLWQAFPGATASQVRHAFIRSGRMFHRPDTLLGHGIPDMRIAFALLAGSQDLKNAEPAYWTLFPNPTEGGFTLLAETGFSGATTVEIFAPSGALHRKAGFSGPGPHRIALPGNGTSGLWLLRIISPLGTEVVKVTGGTGK